MTTPFTPQSLNNVLDPAPRIVVFILFSLASLKNSINCFLFFAL